MARKAAEWRAQASADIADAEQPHKCRACGVVTREGLRSTVRAGDGTLPWFCDPCWDKSTKLLEADPDGWPPYPPMPHGCLLSDDD